jgi:hypothetical protein
MSLVVLAGIVGGVAAAGTLAAGIRWAVKRGRPALAPAPVEERAPAPEPAPTFTMGGLTLGDVVMLRSSEAWLTSALRIQDAGDDEAVLFFSDRTAEQDVLLLRSRPRRLMYHMHAVELPGMGVGPATIEHEQELFTRSRLIPVTVERHGEGCPAVGTAGSWSWFESPAGDVMGCLCTDRATVAWRGQLVDEGAMLHLAAGKATMQNG